MSLRGYAECVCVSTHDSGDRRQASLRRHTSPSINGYQPPTLPTLLDKDMAVAPIQTAIKTKLLTLSPIFLDVVNESYKHSVPANSETHFKVTVVADEFDGISLLERHRMVYDILGDELRDSVHALSIAAKTPAQWEKAGHSIHDTPNCLGGSKHDQQ